MLIMYLFTRYCIHIIYVKLMFNVLRVLSYTFFNIDAHFFIVTLCIRHNEKTCHFRIYKLYMFNLISRLCIVYVFHRRTLFCAAWPRNFKALFMLKHETYPAINVKIPAFTGRINTTSEGFKPIKVFICLHFTFYEQLKCHAKWNRA